ncbi:MAG: pyruvate carboxylase [Desulfobacterales bacterium]|jgi:pyruvate carboxylase|nr:pyruvate carboxylase [Desulfobacterales bacterium]
MIKTFEQIAAEIRGKKILVANRGITARRIIRSIREVFHAVPVLTVTDADKTAPFTAGAQELILLGENPRAYLGIDRIIALAKKQGVAAIHPGWGFASEDAGFPQKCHDADLLFIGPTADAMRLLGNKVKVRELARNIGIPVVPGSPGAVSIAEARKVAMDMGLPVMLKAEGGGGGRGIYEVYDMSQLEGAFTKASTLAQASFGNPRLFVEKLLTSVRHIEIQVIADRHGNVFAFDERDCTVQRNHQKLIEMTPSPWPGMTENRRARLKGYAEKLVKAVGYYSLATVEFLVDGEDNEYLIEVNTRLQVEHGITECRYGIDLVEEQIAIAFGAALRFNAADTLPVSHAVQVRINCEDPRHGFAPNSGLITRYISPGGPGVRLDSCISGGYAFPPHYDSAAALLIAYGRDWHKTLAIMDRALNEYVIGGLKTTIPFHRRIISHPRFISGEYDTRFIATTPNLMGYRDVEPEAMRLSRLVAEISARGFNPFVQLGEYRGPEDKRLGAFAPVLPSLENTPPETIYPRGDRRALLDYLRDSGRVHFTDTTARDITQSNSGNRFRLAEDKLIGPYLDQCGFFSIENGGGAHFHVAMMANMTYPFNEARSWNQFAPKTLKQILVRSTNLLGYKPQPKNLMRLTGEMICAHHDVIRCFDFLNHVDNMVPLAEVVMNSPANVFEPAVSLSWADGFDVPHYLGVVDAMVAMVADVIGLSGKAAARRFILGLKDMAGVCPPRFIRALVTAIREKYPELVIHYHRHFTDGLFVPAYGAAAQAGAHILDTAIGAAVRWYGQGEVLSTAAYIEEEMGLKTGLDKEAIRACNFVLKQIMPYYDRYTAPYFRGIDHDVVHHGMPGGATSSSQEGAMKQGYIHLLPYMLRFLAGTRRIVRYHDVTPGSQITWNTAFLAVTGAFQRGGEEEVRHLLWVLESVAGIPEESVNEALKKERLMLYRESNDAFRDLLMGRFGRLPLGFPPEWVYESVFGDKYRELLPQRTQASPLLSLAEIDIAAEETDLVRQIERDPTDEELVMYLNHPGDALKTIRFRQEFGNPNRLPLDVWFEGLRVDQEIVFNDSDGKPHRMAILDMAPVDPEGVSLVRYALDDETFAYPVKVAAATGAKVGALEMADRDNPSHVGSPSTGDLWVMYVKPGDMVKKGEELFNITIMKQEKAVAAAMDGIVERVLKTADFKHDKKMVPVREGELLVVLGPVPNKCAGCQAPIKEETFRFCPACGAAVA